MPLPEGIDGFCDPAFAEVPRVLAGHIASGAHHGAAVAAYHRGRPVVDVWGGPGWAQDSLAVSFSTTKGPAAIALHMAVERAGVDYDAPVSSVWPEFGKPDVSIRHCLCHEAGVPQIRDELADVTEMADWQAMVAMMERLEPLWEPGTANGYHAINYGWLVGELVRRIDGRPIPQFLAEEIAGPLGLDGCYIGTPDSEHGRIVPLTLPPLPEGAPDLDTLVGQDSITAKALSPPGDIVAFLNSPAGRSTCAPAFSGAFTARSLARLYSMMERGGEGLLSAETIAAATRVQNTRPDLVLVVPVHWRLGFMSGGSAVSPAGPNREAYGHSGFGGSVAFADPRSELALAVTVDLLDRELLGGRRLISVVHAAVAAAESA